MTEKHWGMLERRPTRDPAALADDRDWRLLHLRMFASPAGKEWLERMWARKCGAPVAENVSNEALRWNEAQRQMLRDIERLTAQAMAETESPKAVK
jgi:hypothetical protein